VKVTLGNPARLQDGRIADEILAPNMVLITFIIVGEPNITEDPVSRIAGQGAAGEQKLGVETFPTVVDPTVMPSKLNCQKDGTFLLRFRGFFGVFFLDGDKW